MAFCPACSRTAPVLEMLQVPPHGSYRCRRCGAEAFVDAARFRLAAGACAYLTIIVPVGAYVGFGRLAPTLAALAAWGLLSPWAFASWTVLRLSARPPRGIPPLPREESVPPAHAARGS